MAATLTPEGHIRKRQYQPSLSSFFAHRDAPSSSAPERARTPMSPRLAEETQASLLSVGMRVRKSVPEGYKTHKTIGLQHYPFPSTAPVAKMGVPTKELTPFCGLHKVGGWEAQALSPSSAPAGFGGSIADEDDMPDLMMSQSTMSPTQTSFGINQEAFAGNSRKRGYEEEVEDDLDAYFDLVDCEPTSTLAHRPIARMKQPMKAEVRVQIVGADGNDFEDAMFLRGPEGMDVDF